LIRAPASIFPVSRPSNTSHGHGGAPHELGDAGEGHHTAAVTDLRGQPPSIGLEALGEPFAHRLAREAGALHHVMDDARVGLAAKVVAVDVARRPIDVLESDGERPPPRAARNQDGAVRCRRERGAWSSALGGKGERAQAGPRWGGAARSARRPRPWCYQRPMVKQSEPSISWGAQPMARSDVRRVVPVPLGARGARGGRATPHRSRSRSTLSALAPRRTRLTWWGRRPRREPVSRHSGSEARDGVDEVVAESGQARGLAVRRLGAHQLRGYTQADQRGQILSPRAVPALLPAPENLGGDLEPGPHQSAPAPGGP
jgi:hypothetical protein